MGSRGENYNLKTKWKDYRDTKLYQKIEKEQMGAKTNSSAPKSNAIQVHNRIGESFPKVLRAVHYFSEPILQRLKMRKGWKLDVWLSRTHKSENAPVKCAISFRRPNNTEVYIKSKAGSLGEAVKRTFSEFNRRLNKERQILKAR